MKARAEKFARNGALQLTLPSCDRGIGSIVRSPESRDLIEGVRVSPFPIWPDDRGYFLEVLRAG